MSRYRVSGSEGQYEKNSDEQVLANKLGIADSGEMDEAELVLLEKLYHCIFEEQFPAGQITVALLKSWHRRWLGNIYDVGRARKDCQYQQRGLYVRALCTVAKTNTRIRR